MHRNIAISTVVYLSIYIFSYYVVRSVIVINNAAEKLYIVEVVTTSKKTLHLVFLVFPNTEAIDSV